MCSLAHVAINAPISYVKPKVLEKGVGNLILKDSRHPCIETLPDVNFIPNDVELVRNTSEFQIITGANTGGKSVYLRQVDVAKSELLVLSDSYLVPYRLDASPSWHR